MDKRMLDVWKSPKGSTEANQEPEKPLRKKLIWKPRKPLSSTEIIDGVKGKSLIWICGVIKTGLCTRNSTWLQSLLFWYHYMYKTPLSFLSEICTRVAPLFSSRGVAASLWSPELPQSRTHLHICSTMSLGSCGCVWCHCWVRGWTLSPWGSGWRNSGWMEHTLML